MGHIDRCTIGVPSAQKAMCNPIAQAELLNEAGTELNIIVGLCVGHDALFIRHSKAPVTVLAAKDHVYDNAPLECLKDMQPCLPGFLTLTIAPQRIPSAVRFRLSRIFPDEMFRKGR